MLATCVLTPAAQANAQQPLLADRAMARRLDGSVTLTWNGQALGEALSRLATLHELPLWIDRRVDLQHEIQLSLENESLSTALTRLAEQNDAPWGWSTLRTVVYFGPQEAASELATVSELTRHILAKAPAESRRAWLTPRRWSIPRLAEPKMLVAQTLDDIGVELRNGDAIPHDLWPARELPAIAPVDCVVLALIGFDLAASFSPDGRQVEVVAIERPVRLSHEYRHKDSLEKAANELAAADDSIRVQQRGGRLIVAARWEIHEQLRWAGRPGGPSTTGENLSPGRPKRGEEQRFTLRIEKQPVGRVIEQLAAQVNLTVTWRQDAEGAQSPQQDALVSCDVRDATLDELLKAVLEPAGLACDRDGDRITIRVAQ
jgi:hypothetical protein